MTHLTCDMAAGFARLTLGHIGQQWPYKLDHVMTGPQDVRAPAELHPIFHGSFDWHSCVHGWWQLLTIARLHPGLPEAGEVRARADAMLVPDKVAGELAYLARPASAGFERPYGWGWLLALHGEAARHDAGWGAALEPLARAFAERFAGYLPRLTYPIRTGTHFNTAFALVHALAWARRHDAVLAETIIGWALNAYRGDRDCQAWEPEGDAFLSPALIEALLMAAVLPPADFAAWFDAFLPRAEAGAPASLFTPATVSDRSDGKIAHLDGLNLSRAWCWRRIAAALPEDHAAIVPARATAEAHLAASLPHLADDYMGTHWLASFALLALMAG
ncbi:DUF2891 domain-containing protein [Sphingomonas baiyangensis]|uniref:DUF2891 domain-containing protein n=1 Tax=Sphingomonas baiyangensis TaxID=2572576 RepID=A0A4U1L8K0_9SPHN|nr:DUF2891 domain-containing protein [Sphingomonas baiyangensis]TKD53291.1 DUF2891 domain-containing protein [Sphingomonas baiyangensis]